MVSAYINTPPATPRDYLIAKAILLRAGLTKLDPAKGVKLKPYKPADYQHETKGPAIIAGLSFDIAFIIVFTCIRLCLRASVKRLRWGIDDTLMVIALPMAVAYPALQIASVKYGGAGQHIFDITYEQYYTNQWIANIASVDFFVCVGIVKMSITGFNIRLTSLSSLKWQIINWIFLGLCAIYTLAAFFLNVFQCSPIGSSFDILILERKNVAPTCVGVQNMNVILRTINITLDCCLLAVPIIVLWKVKMSKNKKFRLFALLSVGGFACVGSIMTLVSKFHLKSDTLWNYTGILGWSLVELTLGVLAASLPTLAFLLPRTSDSYGYENKISNLNNSNDNSLKPPTSFPTFAPNPNVSSAVPRTPRDEAFDTFKQPGGHIQTIGKLGSDSFGTGSWLDLDGEADDVEIMGKYHSQRHNNDIELAMNQTRLSPSEISSEEWYSATEANQNGQMVHGTPVYIADVDATEIGRAVSVGVGRDRYKNRYIGRWQQRGHVVAKEVKHEVKPT